MIRISSIGVTGDCGDEPGQRTEAVHVPARRARRLELLRRNREPGADRVRKRLLARPEAQERGHLVARCGVGATFTLRKDVRGDRIGGVDGAHGFDVDADFASFREREKRDLVAMRDAEAHRFVGEARLAVCALGEEDIMMRYAYPITVT